MYIILPATPRTFAVPNLAPRGDRPHSEKLLETDYNRGNELIPTGGGEGPLYTCQWPAMRSEF